MSAEDRLAVVELEIDELRPDPAHPRRMNDREIEALTRSIRARGFVRPILVRKGDRVVIDGHQCLVVGRRLGLKTVPVILLDVGPAEARVIGLAMNRITGEWDQELLGRLLQELNEHTELDLTLSGFDEDESTRLIRNLDARERRERIETFDLDAALEATTVTRTQPGDLWLMGDHRVLCGDSIDREVVSRLLTGEPAAMAFTDPPYNVDYGNHGGQQRDGHRRPILNDAMQPEEWRTFCEGWATNLLRNVDGAIYVCMATKEWGTLSAVLAQAGAHWSDTIIWDKQQPTLGRADYQRRYEPIWYGWREGVKHRWLGGRDQHDVWPIAKPSASPLHPTMKPIELVERAIENSSEPGSTVLDLFLGSGTTLIAAERTGRRCRAVELDRRHVDVAVARWEAFTGRAATREGA